MRAAILFIAGSFFAPAQVRTPSEDEKFQAIAQHYFDSGLDRALPRQGFGGQARGPMLDAFLRARSLARLLRTLRPAALSPDNQIDFDLLERKLHEAEDFFTLENGEVSAPCFCVDLVEQAMLAFPGDLSGLCGYLAGVSEGLKRPAAETCSGSLRAALVRACEAAAPRTAELVDLLRKEHPGQQAWIRACEEYVAAVGSYERHLLALVPDANGPPRPTARQRYVHALRYTLVTDHTPESLFLFALGRYRETLRELEACARKIDPAKTWREIIEDCKERDRFAKEEYPDQARVLAMKARDFVIEKDLATLPPGAREVRVEKGKPRQITPFGNYGGAYVTASLEGLDAETLRERLRDNHRHWTTLVALHEAVPGHHLQFEVVKTLKDRSRLRRSAWASTYVEGWGIYCEEMMYLNGYFADGTKTRLNALKMRLWRCARTTIDAGLQTGAMTRDQAVELLVRGVTLEPSSARLEVEHYAERPTYFSGYLLGFREFMRLREQAERTLGTRFDQKKFHDAILGLGPLPIPELRKAMEHWIASN